jgi:hypothetical protein
LPRVAARALLPAEELTSASLTLVALQELQLHSARALDRNHRGGDAAAACNLPLRRPGVLRPCHNTEL